MSELYWMTIIAERRLLPKFVSLNQEKHIDISFITLGLGTFASEGADRFMAQREKAVDFALVTKETWLEAKRAMRQKLQIDVPGVGVAFIVPMSSIGGRRELSFLTDGQNFTRGEESVMRGTERELIVIISNQGYNELVMDAAREAGAYGGTVIHARGTGMERAEKFLGISLASENDMTFVVVKTGQRDLIMQKIMLKAGMETPAKAIVFSLPVTDTAGLRLLEDDEESNEKSGDESGEKNTQPE